jgi:hypothetical protein
MIYDIWAFDHDQLEKVHNFVQWLFPLPEPSDFNKDAPLLDDETIAAFRESFELQDRLLRSFDVMLNFLELKVAGNKVIRRGEPLHWLTWKNHNFRRLTRIMRCLILLGLRPFAEALRDCLTDIYVEHPVIDEETMRYWKEAVAYEA